MLQYLYKRLRRAPAMAVGVVFFSLALMAVLRGVDASAARQQRNFEQARRGISVAVTVTNLSGSRADGLEAPAWVASTFLGGSDVGNGFRDYLTDVRVQASRRIDNWQALGLERLSGITALGAEKGLEGMRITWLAGWDESLFSGEEALCLVPEGYTQDWDAETPGQQILAQFENTVRPADFPATRYTCSVCLTVAGTYSAEKQGTVYCPYSILAQVFRQLKEPGNVGNVSAVLADNTALEALISQRSKWFAAPDPSGARTRWVGGRLSHYPYALDINDQLLRRVTETLERNMLVNRICRTLVFLLSAAAGIFLGWLTIRQRKREIGLLRTLGTPNDAIFRGFFLEQLGCLALGIVLGGGFFLENAALRLLLLAGLYSLGLFGSLLFFLNTNLMTAIKEAD